MTLPWVALVGIACRPAATEPTGTDTTTEPTPTDTTDTETDSPIDTGTTTPTGSTGSTGHTGTGLDCSVLPPVPVTYTTLNAFNTSEDFDLDGDGFMCSITNSNLACKDLYGTTKIVAPGVAASSAGTRVLPTGDWVVANVGAGGLVRVDAVTGGSVTLLSGLEYPNGVEVDENNQVYVAEQNAGRVRQVDAYTGVQSLVATGLSNPNGVILSPDGNTLYVGSFGGGVIYAVDRLAPEVWDAPRILYNPSSGDGGFDGINVDACGNVYITEFLQGKVYRITPDGLNATLVVDLPSGWIPNLRWGHGINGWETDILYVTAFDRIYALDMGIEGKKHVLAP